MQALEGEGKAFVGVGGGGTSLDVDSMGLGLPWVSLKSSLFMSIRAAHAATKITVGRCRWWGLHKFGVPIKMISLTI